MLKKYHSPLIIDWNVSPAQAVSIQEELRNKISLQPFKKPIHLIGGADISFNRFSTTAYAVFVVLDFKSFSVVDRSYFIGELRFPYIPGLLSFREIPLLIEAWNQLRVKPDILLIDGQGIAHPRRMGIATHLGVILDFPTIGCGKSKLIGNFKEPENQPKAYSDLKIGNQKIGFVYRTKRNTKPIFVSPGNRIDLESTLRVLNSMNYSYRIPEPTRQAHLYANELRIKLSGKTLIKNFGSPLKEPIQIPKAFSLIEKAVQSYPKAAMFELSDRGFKSLFHQLVGCILSIRTFDEVSLEAALRLFSNAKTPTDILNLSVSEIEGIITPSTFRYQKAVHIREIAKICLEKYGGILPCDPQLILSFPGIGPKCANLALGISCGIPSVSVDTHVFRVTHRWGINQSDTAEKASIELKDKIPRKYWIKTNSLLVPFGKHICTRSLPRCSTCPVLKMCQQVGVNRHL